jgi:hypothetical protein
MSRVCSVVDEIDFRTMEVAAVTGIPQQSLRAWIVEGAITPAVEGQKGPGKGHRWSARQLLGLAVVGAIQAVLGRGSAPLEYVRKAAGS